ncbi:hypothetical protein GCM10027422_42310 [Hymenobacter arcticus]
MTDKQKYYHLLGEVCEAMPSSAVDSAIRAGYGQENKSASTRLHHVKQGKVASLTDLLALVRFSMPNYDTGLPATRGSARSTARAAFPLGLWKRALLTNQPRPKAPAT